MGQILRVLQGFNMIIQQYQDLRRRFWNCQKSFRNRSFWEIRYRNLAIKALIEVKNKNKLSCWLIKLLITKLNNH
jgi:hypothetical protein